jgi:hypothetical protein
MKAVSGGVAGLLSLEQVRQTDLLFSSPSTKSLSRHRIAHRLFVILVLRKLALWYQTRA